MPEMRHPQRPARRRGHVRNRAVRSRRGLAAISCVAAIVATAGPALATPAPSSVETTGALAPEPFRTFSPPRGSPFEEVVGGAQLGISGVPVVADGVIPPPAIAAKAWLVADIESGRVFAALNPHVGLPPASTIKLLTAIALLPEVDMDATYVVTDADVTVEGSRVGLVPGQRYTRDELIHGLLLASGNDTANALAQLVGGQSRALSLMAKEAERLGAYDTTATTTHGLDDPRQHTSAYDLALIAREVLDDKELAAVARTRTYDFPGLDAEIFQIQNHNRLLGSYAGAVGLKTGFTTLSGHAIVAAANRDEVPLVVVVLGAEDRAELAASALFDWAFALPRDATPVGRLVTPTEVAAAVQAHDSARSASAPPVQRDATRQSGGGLQPATSRSAWVWPAVVLVAVLAAVLTVWRSRVRRARTSAAAARPGPRRARRG
jgi:serine-type D-Ala-D-Ala carboxypeptidase (penicillin-binding protein 5/6)